jgi:predicted phage tail protein
MGLFTKGSFWAAVVAVLVIAVRYYMPGIPVEDSVLATLIMAGIAAVLLAFGIKVDALAAQKKELQAKLDGKK